jgi:hypothetical protein
LDSAGKMSCICIGWRSISAGQLNHREQCYEKADDRHAFGGIHVPQRLRHLRA